MASSAASAEAMVRKVVSRISTEKPAAFRCDEMYSRPSGGYGFITFRSTSSSARKYPCVSRISTKGSSLSQQAESEQGKRRHAETDHGIGEAAQMAQAQRLAPHEHAGELAQAPAHPEVAMNIGVQP